MSDIPPPTVPPAMPPPPGGGSYTPPPPPPGGGFGGGGNYGGGGAPASSDRTLMIVLSYIGLLALIPYLMKKDDPDTEVRWHAKNGMGLLIAEIAVGVVFFVLSMMFRNSVGLGCGLGAIQCVLWLGFIAISIICIIKGVGGQRFRIPGVTDFAEKSL